MSFHRNYSSVSRRVKRSVIFETRDTRSFATMTLWEETFPRARARRNLLIKNWIPGRFDPRLVFFWIRLQPARTRHRQISRVTTALRFITSARNFLKVSKFTSINLPDEPFISADRHVHVPSTCYLGATIRVLSSTSNKRPAIKPRGTRRPYIPWSFRGMRYETVWTSLSLALRL